jgi:DNA-binding response OmpR family regulator
MEASKFYRLDPNRGTQIIEDLPERRKKPSKYKVLVVDDEEPVRQLIVAILSGETHQCLTAGNSVDALKMAGQIAFDAIITDIVMPEMNGIVLTREFLGLYPALPVMVMTGYTKEYHTALALEAGARDFIGKPFDNDEFILRFNKMMRDQEVSLDVEARRREILFQTQTEASEQINEQRREIETLTSQLNSGYHGVRF